MKEKHLNFVERFSSSAWNFGQDSIVNRTWSGGRDTIQKIYDSGLDYVDRFFELAEDVWGTDEIELDKFNDWLWLDRCEIYNYLGLSNGDS